MFSKVKEENLSIDDEKNEMEARSPIKIVPPIRISHIKSSGNFKIEKSAKGGLCGGDFYDVDTDSGTNIEKQKRQSWTPKIHAKPTAAASTKKSPSLPRLLPKPVVEGKVMENSGGARKITGNSLASQTMAVVNLVPMASVAPIQPKPQMLTTVQVIGAVAMQKPNAGILKTASPRSTYSIQRGPVTVSNRLTAADPKLDKKGSKEPPPISQSKAECNNPKCAMHRAQLRNESQELAHEIARRLLLQKQLSGLKVENEKLETRVKVLEETLVTMERSRLGGNFSFISDSSEGRGNGNALKDQPTQGNASNNCSLDKFLESHDAPLNLTKNAGSVKTTIRPLSPPFVLPFPPIPVPPPRFPFRMPDVSRPPPHLRPRMISPTFDSTVRRALTPPSFNGKTSRRAALLPTPATPPSPPKKRKISRWDN